MSEKRVDSEALYKQGLSWWDARKYAEAFTCFKEAAEQGHTDSCLQLGLLYLNGDGVEKDATIAERWLLSAAEQGHAEADYHLARIYFFGEGSEKTRKTPIGELYKDAERRAKRAAEKNIEGAKRLALRISDYLEFLRPEWDWGDEVDEDEVEGYEQAALRGSVIAQYELMRIYGCYPEHEMDGELRLQRLLPLCECGYAEAQRTLAQMYQRGDGIPRDIKQAVHWYRRSAELGYSEAQYSLAELYRKGEGVERDLTEAFRLYSLAAGQRHDFAELSLGEMYAAGEGVERDITTAVYWYLCARESRQVSMAAALDKLSEMQKKYPEEYDRGWVRYRKEQK